MTPCLALLNLMRVAAITLVLGGMATACGAADSAMSDPGPCPAPTPPPTTAFGRRDPLGAFRQTVNQNVIRLEKLTNDFRQQYSNGKFYRGSFRPDFGRYADETVCIAIALRGVTLPAGLASTKVEFDSALDGFINHQRSGREAVRSRNVSGYKDWYNGIYVQLGALRSSVGVSVEPP
jgi:hypothetical protein